jgi:hypothetical protein
MPTQRQNYRDNNIRSAEPWEAGKRPGLVSQKYARQPSAVKSQASQKDADQHPDREKSHH